MASIFSGLLHTTAAHQAITITVDRVDGFDTTAIHFSHVFISLGRADLHTTPDQA